ncbi:MAG TPA: hypothetical protein DDX19_02625 [Rhodopirellula baltica]|uniref:hypothetical protein n=1 Tax=Rhodopirellula baltica TaxID=265606 RepID=UPI000319A743|nr:hypothetical protein [Rhodopirellula baltica]HBE61668.1 hypothetical protein [Rhodopirellula baltica]
MANLKDPRWIWFKGGLFVVTGVLASLVLIANSPSVQTIVLLAVAIWSFCRAYYFAFYVIERCVDPKSVDARVRGCCRPSVCCGQ